jgi:predicted transposase YdaD
MKTDTIFYQLFNTFHTLLFELIERPIAEAEGYEFSSVEVKEKAFRFDGIFSPKAEDKETVLVYKFPKLTREEIEAMFTYSDLKQTRVYQEARAEGEQRGLKLGEQRGLVKGQATMLLRMLSRKFGQITPTLRGKVNKLSAKQLENLAEDLFDLESIADLNNWLKTKGKGN